MIIWKLIIKKVFKLLFSHSFLSLITSSWQTLIVIKSESVTLPTQLRSRQMKLNTANMAHRNLLHQKLSIRPLCPKQQTSGRVSFQFLTSFSFAGLICLNTSAFSYYPLYSCRPVGVIAYLW